MKKVSLIFLLLVPILLFSQSIEPRIIKEESFRFDDLIGDYELHEIEEFSYDSRGNLVTINSRILNDQGEFELKQHKREYNSKNQLIKDTWRRYNEDVRIWITISWEIFEYDEKGCLIFKDEIQNVGSIHHLYHTYTNDENCNVTEDIFRSSVDGDTILFHLIEYPDNFGSYKKFKYSDFIPSNGEWDLYEIDEKHFNEKSELIREIQSDYRLGTSRKDEYEYDDHGNILTNKIYFGYLSSAGDEWIYTYDQIDMYENIYDENDYLVFQNLNRYSTYGGTLTFYHTTERAFVNDCYGTIEEFRDSLGSFSNKKKYYYEGKDNCQTFQESDIEVIIFPNPTAGFLELKSPLLLTGDVQIKIVNMKGQLIFEKMVYTRTEQTNLNLTALPNGIYSIQLLNQDIRWTEKLVIVK